MIHQRTEFKPAVAGKHLFREYQPGSDGKPLAPR
jgi:hypothetical protein